jgi:uracil-DNA glycosylase
LNIDLKVGELVSIEINGYLVNILPIFHPSPINPNSLRLNNEIFKRLNSALTKIINNIKSLYGK